MNMIGYVLAVAAVVVPLLSIFLSKRGIKTHALTIISFACLSGFLILSLFYISELAAANDWTTLVRDVSMRSKASVALAIVVVVLNFIPFITFQTKEDYKLKKAREQAFEEGKKAEAQKEAEASTEEKKES